MGKRLPTNIINSLNLFLSTESVNESFTHDCCFYRFLDNTDWYIGNFFDDESLIDKYLWVVFSFKHKKRFFVSELFMNAPEGILHVKSLLQ